MGNLFEMQQSTSVDSGLEQKGTVIPNPIGGNAWIGIVLEDGRFYNFQRNRGYTSNIVRDTVTGGVPVEVDVTNAGNVIHDDDQIGTLLDYRQRQYDPTPVQNGLNGDTSARPFEPVELVVKSNRSGRLRISPHGKDVLKAIDEARGDQEASEEVFRFLARAHSNDLDIDTETWEYQAASPKGAFFIEQWENQRKLASQGETEEDAQEQDETEEVLDALDE